MYANKKEFIARMAEIYDVKKVDAADVTEMFLGTLMSFAIDQQGVRLLGDLVMTIKDVDECTRPNPRDRSEQITTPAHKKAVIKLGKNFQDAANGILPDGFDDEDSDE